MRVDWRQVGAVLLILAWVNSPFGYGYTVPIRGDTPVELVISMVMFVGYIYFAKSLFRLPFAINMAIRRYRHARQHYKLELGAALFDGFYRGFLDRRRWETGVLAVTDRLVLLVIVLIACLPVLGAYVVSSGGIIGVIIMLLVYIYTGRFALLVDDGIADNTNPFGNIPNLRRPDDDIF